MENFNLHFDALNRLAFISYHDTVDYLTLMKSLKAMFALNMPERAGIVLDFSDVKSFIVGYSQIRNFRFSLRLTLAPEALSRIAVIDDPKSFWGRIICSSTPLIETEQQLPDMRRFEPGQWAEARHWV